MTKIDIVSGFLGAGKTTFIQRLLDEALKTEQVVLIENEFGEIGIDGGFLKDAGIEIREMNQGCICCSLVGDFETSLKEVVETYHPDRIIIEPSGVGKLSDIIGAVKSVSGNLPVELHAAVTVVDAKKAKMYARNFGEFFNNQIEYAGTIVLSRTDIASEEKIQEAVRIVRELNADAAVITTPLAELSGSKLQEIISRPDRMEEEMLEEVMERVHEHEHHHHHDDEDEEHEHHHHHDDDEDEHEHHHHDEDEDEHEHHHHDDDDDDEEEEHGHHHHHHHEHHDEVILREDGVRVHRHHEHDEDEEHEHHHEHHDHDHDADEIFQTWGFETPHPFDRQKLEDLLRRLSETEEFGMVVRAKGMLATGESGKWMYFDMVPEQTEIREGSPDYTGKVVVIGSDLKEELLEKAFLD